MVEGKVWERSLAKKRDWRPFPAFASSSPALQQHLGRWHDRGRKKGNGLHGREGRRSGKVPESSSMQMG